MQTSDLVLQQNDDDDDDIHLSCFFCDISFIMWASFNIEGIEINKSILMTINVLDAVASLELALLVSQSVTLFKN